MRSCETVVYTKLKASLKLEMAKSCREHPEEKVSHKNDTFVKATE